MALELFKDGKYSLPEGTIKVRACEFENEEALIHILFPESVIGIESFAFLGCSNLTDLHFPKYLTWIGQYTFYGCSSLTEIIFPDGITEIKGFAFSKCSNLQNVIFPQGLTQIGNNAFSYCVNLKRIIIPQKVTRIRRNAFAHCTELTHITLPKNIKEISEKAFLNCTKLQCIIVDPVNKNELESIKRLLPTELQSKVISLTDFQYIQQIKQKVLFELYRIPGINPLFQQICGGQFEKDPLQDLPDDLWYEINCHLGEHLPVIQKAMQLLDQIELPADITSNQDLSNYQIKCASTINDMVKRFNNLNTKLIGIKEAKETDPNLNPNQLWSTKSNSAMQHESSKSQVHRFINEHFKKS